jgi:predicted transcriptional regulator
MAMPCINSDGTLVQAARDLMLALESGLTPEAASAKLEVPLFKTRIRLRELVKEGLIEPAGDTYVVTSPGREKLSSPSRT